MTVYGLSNNNITKIWYIILIEQIKRWFLEAAINRFVEIVSRYEQLTDITPEQMHELIERIEVHAPDKSSGHRRQKIDIYFRFKVASASVTLDSRNSKKKAA